MSDGQQLAASARECIQIYMTEPTGQTQPVSHPVYGGVNGGIMADAATLRERNRKRRNKSKKIVLRYLVDAAFLAAFVTLIVGWSLPLVVLFLIVGCIITAPCVIMSAYSFRDFFKFPKKSPEYKAAVWGMIFYTLFAVVGILLIVYGAINL